MHQATADKGASTSAAGEKKSATQTTTGVHASTRPTGTPSIAERRTGGNGAPTKSTVRCLPSMPRRRRPPSRDRWSLVAAGGCSSSLSSGGGGPAAPRPTHGRQGHPPSAPCCCWRRSRSDASECRLTNTVYCYVSRIIRTIRNSGLLLTTDHTRTDHFVSVLC
jgi:hypothetical protein